MNSATNMLVPSNFVIQEGFEFEIHPFDITNSSDVDAVNMPLGPFYGQPLSAPYTFPLEDTFPASSHSLPIMYATDPAFHGNLKRGSRHLGPVHHSTVYEFTPVPGVANPQNLLVSHQEEHSGHYNTGGTFGCLEGNFGGSMLSSSSSYHTIPTWGPAAANGSPSDNAHHAHPLHERPLRTMSSDDQGIAALTPPADHHSGAGSPTDYSSPQYFQSPAAEPARRPSNGRTLVPLPALCTANSSGTVATTSSTSSSGGPCTPAAGGPLARNYAIPPRPKPGRKPATDEPASKRKAQNRESQRAFRARKAAKVTELAEQVDEMQKQHNLEKNELLNEINSLAKRLHDAERACEEQMKFTRHAEEDRDYWKEQHDNALRSYQTDGTQSNSQINGRNDATATLYQPPPSNDHNSPAHHSVTSFHGFGTPISDDVTGGCGDCKPGDCACINKMAEDMKDIETAFDAPFMPAVPLPRRKGRSTTDDKSELSSDPFEIDFTAQYGRPSTALLDDDQKIQDCGFCADGGHCVCRDAREKLQAEAEIASARNKKIAPGGCADCQTDPARRAWCLRVAQLREEEGPRSRRNSGSRSPKSLDTLEPPVVSRIDMNISRASPIPGKRSVGCSETFRLLDGRIPMDDPSAWNNLRPMLPDGRRDTFTMEPRVYSAMEIDAADIITTMQNSRGPLKPRPEDGEYAPLVTAAEERRRATNSPAVLAKDDEPTPMELTV